MSQTIDNEGWQQRWREGRTGFHLDQVHPLLLRYHELLPPRCRVLVPLCGKSLDLAWLSQQGHEVCAVELSEVAVRELHAEAGVQPEVQRVGDFEVFRSSLGEVWQGDFFALPGSSFEPVDAVWDRGSLIAVARERRGEYATALGRLVRPAAPGLLVTVHYPPSQMSGPPFSVSEEEVRAAFAPPVEVRLREVEDVLSAHPRFERRGLTSLAEAVYELRWPSAGDAS